MTMTPINTFQDILDAMDQNPALRDALRRHILTEELLQLPAAVHQLRADVEELKAGQARLETDMAEVKSDVAELKVGQARLETTVARLETETSRMGGHVSRLAGSDYQTRITRLAPRRLRDFLGVQAALVQDNIPNIISNATQQDAITSDEANALELADTVLSGVNADGDPVYVLAEISITVQTGDINRAQHRSAILEKATGIPTLPVTFGSAISERGASLAAQEKVTFILIALDPVQPHDQPPDAATPVTPRPPSIPSERPGG